METNHKVLVALWHFVVWFVMLNIKSGYASVSDVYCLRTMKESIGDPFGYLSSWDFRDTSEGSICKFVGIDCWHDDENKVLNIQLSGFGLTGQFPSGLENCSSLIGLDLSNNKFTGFLPPHISQMIKFATLLDLSSNYFSGEMPESLANCTHLNVLRLNDNQLTGRIPLELGTLSRLKEFSVANNDLEGRVPTFTNSVFTEKSYENNPWLCGGPLEACQGFVNMHAGIITTFIVGATVGVVTSMFIVFVFGERIFTLFLVVKIRFWSMLSTST